MVRFRVHDLRQKVCQKGNCTDRNHVDDVNSYLMALHARLHNAVHAETRIYTCRSWHILGGTTAPYELHWNDEVVPDETFLGSFGWSVGYELVEKIEAEFAKGEPVRLFIFNSDADLCFEEVLEPVHET